MKKSDLTDKSTVKFANGTVGIVCIADKSETIKIFSGIIINIEDFDENLKCKFDNRLDIIDVQKDQIKNEYADMLHQLEGLLNLASRTNNAESAGIELSQKTITYLPGIIQQFKKFSKV